MSLIFKQTNYPHNEGAWSPKSPSRINAQTRSAWAEPIRILCQIQSMINHAHTYVHSNNDKYTYVYITPINYYCIKMAN